jgi:hypothetical protein
VRIEFPFFSHVLRYLLLLTLHQVVLLFQQLFFREPTWELTSFERAKLEVAHFTHIDNVLSQRLNKYDSVFARLLISLL